MKRRGETVMFVSPVQRTSVQGRGEYAFVKPDGTAIPAGRSFAKNVGKRYNFPSTIDGTHIKTGLERLVRNPWYEKDIDNPNEGLPPYFHIGSDWMADVENIVNKENITKQLELEIRFNLKRGQLTNRKLLKAAFKSRSRTMDDPYNYLETFSIILYDRPNRFDDTTLRGALAMELCKCAPKIANTKAKSNPSMHHFYISEENEAAIERAARQDIINDAVTDLTLLRRNHDAFLSYQVAVILQQVKGRVAPIVIKERVERIYSQSW